MENIKDAVIIPTYGYISLDPKDMGSQVTIERIDAVRDLMHIGQISKKAIVPFPQHKSLGENVASYVQRFPEFRYTNIRILNETMSTWEDTRKSIEMISGIAGKQPMLIHFVTDWAQPGRLRIIWHCIEKPPNWRACFHIAETSREDIWKHEPGSYIKLAFITIPKYFLIRMKNYFALYLRDA